MLVNDESVVPNRYRRRANLKRYVVLLAALILSCYLVLAGPRAVQYLMNRAKWNAHRPPSYIVTVTIRFQSMDSAPVIYVETVKDGKTISRQWADGKLEHTPPEELTIESMFNEIIGCVLFPIPIIVWCSAEYEPQNGYPLAFTVEAIDFYHKTEIFGIQTDDEILTDGFPDQREKA